MEFGVGGTKEISSLSERFCIHRTPMPKIDNTENDNTNTAPIHSEKSFRFKVVLKFLSFELSFALSPTGNGNRLAYIELGIQINCEVIDNGSFISCKSRVRHSHSNQSLTDSVGE